MARAKKSQYSLYRRVCRRGLASLQSYVLHADVMVFHAGTESKSGKILQTGGRTLNVTATAPTLQQAVDLAYKGVECCSFEGMQFRRDIAHRYVGSLRAFNFA